MEPDSVTIEESKTLSRFCETFTTTYSGSWPPSEDALAKQFVSFFGIEGLLGMEQLEQFCRSIGVEVSTRDLPRPLRGHNCSYQGNSKIVVGAVQGPAEVLGSREHTLLHELRELIEHEFRKLGRPVATTLADLESRAEQFPGLVRFLASFKASEWAFESIGRIESRWIQAGAILLAVVLSMAYYTACLTLPHWEDQFPG